METIIKCAESLKRINEYIDRLKELFKYKTLDEEPPGKEHVASSMLFIEIGGPCCHVKIVIKTRAEHDILTKAMFKIVDNRKLIVDKELTEACLLRINRKDK